MILAFLALALAAPPDRTGPPAVAPPVAMAHAEPEVGEVDGVRVWSQRVSGARKVAIHLRFERGFLDFDPSGPPPAVSALNGLWGLATASSDEAALAATLDAIGADLAAFAGARVSYVDIGLPLAKADDGAALLADVAWSPVFPRVEHRLARRDDALWYLRDGPASPGAVADSALGFAWYPAAHPNGRRPSPSEIRRLPLGDVTSAYAALIDEVPIEVFVVGDLDRARAEALARVALAGHGRDGERGAPPAPPVVSGTRVIAVDMPGKELANVRLRLAGPGRADADVRAAEIASYALTGHFLARLNRNLREDKGFTYGVWGGLSVGDLSGTFGVGVDVKPAAVGQTLREIDGELGRLAAEGVRADEVDLAWRSFVDDWNQWFRDAESAAGGYERSWWRGMSVGSLREELDAYKAVTPDATRAAANRWWGPEAPRVWVVVGERAVLEPQLAGRAVTWVTPEQAILGTF